ncbi:hypothetical protein [Flavobacterium davisii]|uniref:Uncharacterized protein n=1 Tax=Flavobacterium columnare TaxID=996 RepID=A0A8G0KVK4_9FLAO|nr:hypothetical protein [Flavobacterium davisii]QYS88025.1 hypothetical protein JJC05_09095 [Flavobacterium davisii]
MAKKRRIDVFTLPKDTIIEVISIKGEKVVKNNMTYENALKLRNNKGWKNIFYQVGYSHFTDGTIGKK